MKAIWTVTRLGWIRCPSTLSWPIITRREERGVKIAPAKQNIDVNNGTGSIHSNLLKVLFSAL
jgi:hypothetical protein